MTDYNDFVEYFFSSCPKRARLYFIDPIKCKVALAFAISCHKDQDLVNRFHLAFPQTRTSNTF